jgi:hypothetical protein
MTTAEHIYRALLRLYPEEHRQAYGKQMQQHARDLELAARERGRLYVAALYLHLLGDGLFNAGKEYWLAQRAAGGSIEPAPWTAVLLAAVPGLWKALPGPALPVLGAVYIALMVVFPLFGWLRDRRLPVWALLPLGMLVGMLILVFKISVVTTVVPQATPISIDVVFSLLMLALAAGIFAVLLRGRSIPAAANIVIALLLLSGLLSAVILSRTPPWSPPWSYLRLQRPMLYLSWVLTMPAMALLLVAIGLPAARRHNVLALLVVIGGYGTMFVENDTLWGSPIQDWPGLPLYMAGMVFLFFVLAPVGLLRAKTRLGQAIAIFVPATIFLSARLAVPVLVIGQAYPIRPGGVLRSVTVLLCLILGWLLFSYLGDIQHEASPGVSIEAM